MEKDEDGELQEIDKGLNAFQLAIEVLLIVLSVVLFLIFTHKYGGK